MVTLEISEGTLSYCGINALEISHLKEQFNSFRRHVAGLILACDIEAAVENKTLWYNMDGKFLKEKRNASNTIDPDG